MSTVTREATSVNPTLDVTSLMGSMLGLDDDQAEDLDPSTWPSWTDADVWALGPDVEPSAEDLEGLSDWTAETTAREHLDASQRLTLAELAEHQATFYGSWGNAAGDMLASAMTELALKIRLTGATCPDQFDARMDALDLEARQDWEAIGYEQGLAAGRREARPAGSAFGHGA